MIDFPLKPIFTISIISLMILFEITIPFFKFKKPFVKRIGFNFILGVLNTIITSFTVGILINYTLRDWQEGFLNSFDNNYISFIIGFIALDIYIYCWHRFIMHGVGWKLHKLHHEDETMNSSSAFRFHPVEVVLSQLPRAGVIFILGINPLTFLIYEIIFLVFNVIEHSNIKLPNKIDYILSVIFITPNMHKIHHSKETINTNSNYSTIFSIWDKLFKSKRYGNEFKDGYLGL